MHTGEREGCGMRIAPRLCRSLARSGEWVPHVGEKGEPEMQDYYVNDSLYQMIEAGWDLNESKLRRVGPCDAEEEDN